MSSFVYDSALEDQARGNIDFGSDMFKAMLVGKDYIPNRRLHSRRIDVFGEAEGEGYDAGGVLTSVTISRDSGSGMLNIELGGLELPEATISAKGAVYYKSRGGKPAQDELIAYIDFDGLVSSLRGRWSLSESVVQFQPRPGL